MQVHDRLENNSNFANLILKNTSDTLLYGKISFFIKRSFQNIYEIVILK